MGNLRQILLVLKGVRFSSLSFVFFFKLEYFTKWKESAILVFILFHFIYFFYPTYPLVLGYLYFADVSFQRQRVSLTW